MINKKSKYRHNYYIKHKKEERESRRIYMKNHKWLASFYDAKRRCTRKNRKDYSRYGGKGIKFMMSSEDFKTLWFRDKAYLMKQPSIDRINNRGNYEIKNCRFIEKSENTGLSKRKKVIQKTIFGVECRIWDSIKSICEELGFDRSNLSEAIHKHRIAYDFKWEFYNEKL